MLKIAKNKDCTKLSKWLRSLKNHIYWTAASSKTPQERVAKWTSILNHVQDIHTHDDPAFPQSLHPLRTSKDKSKWLKPGEYFILLTDLMYSNNLFNYIFFCSYTSILQAGEPAHFQEDSEGCRKAQPPLADFCCGSFPQCKSAFCLIKLTLSFSGNAVQVNSCIEYLQSLYLYIIFFLYSKYYVFT